jgi:3D (Asp-Asp-Asp) domain-containing protein
MALKSLILAALLTLPIGVARPIAASDFAANTPPSVELLHDVAVTPMVAPATPGKQIVWMEVTAYCGCKKCCGPNATGITASGRSITYNGGLFAAADTHLLPFGTQLVIPGYASLQPVEVIDRGGAIRGHHIDVFFPTHEQALAWGRQWLPVTVVEGVPSGSSPR